MNTPVRPGVLYLIPTPLDFGCDVSLQQPLTDVLPDKTLRTAAATIFWVTENAKSTRAFLKRVGATHPLARPIQEQALMELPRALHKKGDFGGAQIAEGELRPLLSPALQGSDVALVSEAGMPAIADPGALVVRLAHQLGIPVVPLVGPSSLLLALAASGMNGQRFAFVGYLPQQASERVQAISQLEAKARSQGETQLVIETPFRNTSLLGSLLQSLKPTTLLSVSVGLTLEKPTANTPLQTHSALVSSWRKTTPQLDWTLPAVFAIAA